MKLILLVHPGSLCGSFESFYDFSSSYRCAAKQWRDAGCREVVEFPGMPVAILGSELYDEIPTREAVEEAVDRCRIEGRVLRAAPDKDSLQRVAQRIWRRYGGSAAEEIVVTGAWADEEDGCAYCVLETLKALSAGLVPVRLSDYAASMERIESEREEWAERAG